MAEMTTNERVKRMYEHREADRVPVTDVPWGSTVERWRKEGLPEGVSWRDYFGTDRFASIQPDNSPRYPVKVLEESDEFRVATTSWGVTTRRWTHAGGVPEFLDFKIVDPDSWAKAKERMTPDRDRIPWKRLERDYKRWRDEGYWLSGTLWFGFDVTHSHAVGTERVLMAMVTDPDWIVDMFNTFLDVHIALYEQVFEAGYKLDEMFWYDDLGYKGKLFFSKKMYRDMLKPVHKRAAEWAHSKGMKTRLHSCGYVAELIPDFIDLGIDMLNPLEVKAGMDPIALKKEYGDRMGFHGGLNAVLFETPEKLWPEMEKIIPAMKGNGGYIAGSDHSVPENVSLEEFRRFVDLAKKLGSYS